MNFFVMLLCAFFVSCSSLEIKPQVRKPQQVVGDIGGSKIFPVPGAPVVNRYKALHCDMTFDIKIGSRLHEQVGCLYPEDANGNSGNCSSVPGKDFQLIDDVVGRACYSEVTNFTVLSKSSNNPYKQFYGAAATLFVRGSASQAHMSVRLGDIRSLPAGEGALSTITMGTDLIKEIQMNPAQNLQVDIPTNFKYTNGTIKQIHISCKPVTSHEPDGYFQFADSNDAENFNLKRDYALEQCDKINSKFRDAKDQLQAWKDHQNN